MIEYKEIDVYRLNAPTVINIIKNNALYEERYIDDEYKKVVVNLERFVENLEEEFHVFYIKQNVFEWAYYKKEDDEYILQLIPVLLPDRSSAEQWLKKHVKRNYSLKGKVIND